jgi:hypothetical protein
MEPEPGVIVIWSLSLVWLSHEWQVTVGGACMAGQWCIGGSDHRPDQHGQTDINKHTNTAAGLGSECPD